MSVHNVCSRYQLLKSALNLTHDLCAGTTAFTVGGAVKTSHFVAILGKMEDS